MATPRSPSSPSDSRAPEPTSPGIEPGVGSDACSRNLAEANERADVLQRKLDEQDAVTCKALEEAQQRCAQLQQELDEATRARASAEAKASTEAELREVFRLNDQDRSGDETVKALSKANERADLLQRKLEGVQQRCARLQHELDESIRLSEAEAKASTKDSTEARPVLGKLQRGTGTLLGEAKSHEDHAEEIREQANGRSGKGMEVPRMEVKDYDVALQSQACSLTARSSSITSLDGSEAYTIITQLRAPSPDAGKSFQTVKHVDDVANLLNIVRVDDVVTMRQELMALQQRNKDLEEANLELIQENSHLLVVAHEVEDSKSACGHMQQELEARGEQLQAAEQRMRDALDEVQNLQSALRGMRGELESERQISNQRKADTVAAKKRAKIDVAAAQKEAQEAAQQLDALQVAAESLRRDLEAVVAELTLAKTAEAVDAERIVEQKTFKTWLKEELERLKAERQKEQKARALGCFVPWLHV